MVDGIWPQVQLFLNVSDVYERIEKLPDNVESIMEMLASFGELFVDGSLGRCLDSRTGPDEPCDIIMEGTGRGALKRKVANVLKALARLESEDPFDSMIRYWNDYINLRQITNNAKYLFRYTWQCYHYLKTDVVAELLSRRDSELVPFSSYSECRGWIAEDPAQWKYLDGTHGSRYVSHDGTLNNVLREIGPNCSSYDDECKFYDEYADEHGLIGGESNRCLQNIVVRASHYDEEAFKAFLVEIHKYLLQDLTLYGIWLPLTQANETERIRRKTWVRENIAVLSKQLLAARELFNETRMDVTSTDVPVQNPLFPTTPTVDQNPLSPTTPTVDQNTLSPTTLTADVVESIVFTVMSMPENDMDRLLWKERPSRYDGMIKKIVNDIKRESNFPSEGSVEGVMYLPYADNDHSLCCVQKLTENDNQSAFHQKHNYKGASVFIKWTWRPMPSGIMSSRIGVIRSHESAIWDAVFGEKVDDLCKNVRTAVSDNKLIGHEVDGERSEFTAVVAIRCAYEFVWYELGWRYYKAAATTSEYVVSRHAGSYNDACGQMIFLT